jgi:hypothetical protein
VVKRVEQRTLKKRGVPRSATKQGHKSCGEAGKLDPSRTVHALFLTLAAEMIDHLTDLQGKIIGSFVEFFMIGRT